MRSFLIAAAFLLACTNVFAQKTDTLVKKLDQMHRTEQQPSEKQKPDIDKEDYTSQTNITPKVYFILLGTDLVQEVTGPFHTAGKTWVKVAAWGLAEGALIFADKSIQTFAVKFMADNPGMKNVSQYITNFGGAYEGYTLAAFAAYGFIFKSNKVKTTTLLATQSYLAAGALETAVKVITGRQRPSDFQPGKEDNLVFYGPYKGSQTSAFPSGHTTAAFSAATVFAQEYRNEILIPVIAYTAATLVGVSRITQNAHWATDVFAGAALGYVTGKQVVYNYHRYARLMQGKEHKTTFFFNLQYNGGVIMPGMVVKF
jgi:membrane-associated phospholipid phosphatase